MSAQLDVDLGGRLRSLSPTLVRSWCRCETCGETATGLRWASPTDVPADLVADAVEQVGTTLQVQWSDGHRSRIDLTTVEQSNDAVVKAEPSLPMQTPRPLTYADVVTTDSALLAALDMLATSGIALIRAAPIAPDATATLAERFGPIRVTSYGQVQVFITAPDAQTAAHTGNPQHPHTDEPFRYSPPGFLFFHSLGSAAEGQGTSLLVDGFAAAEQLRREDPQAFETLATTKIEAHRVYDGYRFSTMSTVLTVGDDGTVQGVRLNNRSVAPLNPLADGVDETVAALAAFSRIIENPDNQLRLHLMAGDMLVFDNHRVMHGRTGFSDDQPRHLRSCNVDRDEVHSKHRTLTRAAGRPDPILASGPTT